MENNPIKYSDLIQNDGAIQEAISELTLLKDTYKGLTDTVKVHAKDLGDSMRTTSNATEEGRNVTRKAADDASKLEKAQRDLAFAMSETGTKVAELRMQISEKNKESRVEATFVNSTSRSYREMKAEVTLLTAQYQAMSREQAINSGEGINLMNKILSLKSAVKGLDDALKLEQKSLNATTSAQQTQKVVLTDAEKARQKLTFAMSAENAELLTLMAQTKEANMITKLSGIVATEAEGSYNRLSAQYALNKIALNKMSQAEREGTAAGMQLVKETNDMYTSMSRLQEVTGKHTLSVGNYRKSWDGLGMGVSQVIRELPAAAISLNTFFLGISNNIPILVDEIKKVNAANAIATANGEKTTNVFKKLLGAFFGWNTMLVIALTIFSIYGQKIIDWIGNLFGIKKALDKVTSAHDNFTDAMKKGKQDAQAEVVRLRLLYNATQDVTKQIDYRKKAIAELKQIYPAYFKNMTDEAILAGKASNAYIVLAGAIMKAAMSRASEDKIVENSKKLLELEDKKIGYQALAILKQKELNKAKADAKDQSAVVGGSTVAVGSNNTQALNKVGSLTGDLKDLGDQSVNTQRQIDELNKANVRLAGNIDITDLKLAKDPKGKNYPKAPKDRTEEIERANLEIRKKYAESVTALEEDELIKQKAALKDTFDSESAMLMNKYNNDKDLTEESRGLILQIIKNWSEQLGVETQDVDDEIMARSLQQIAETLQLRLEATIEGTTEENKVRLQIMENSRQQEILANSRLIGVSKQSEADINAKWDNIIATERNRSIYELGMEGFDLQQKLAASEFDLLRHTESEKTKFKLQQEKERWKKMLEYAKAGALLLTNTEIKTIENLIKKIDQDLAKADNKQLDFYSLFGLKPTDEEREAVNTIIDTTLSNLKSAIDSEVQLADIAVDSAQKRVDAKQSILDKEIEARNNGYAFNVTQAQRELDAEKRNLDIATKQKEKAVRAQQRLDGIVQVSSLITASAKIWSALGGFPPLAIAGIAMMWGSYALSKIKANEVTKAQAQTYGEGGYEMLNGGSHQSGNDISIGTMPDGRERRAEGGEALAIINKKQTRKYKHLIPDVINSLNKGVFEKKYSSAFNTDNINIGVTAQSPSLKDLENNVREIKQQGEKRSAVDAKGREVVFYKNLKTTYLS